MTDSEAPTHEPPAEPMLALAGVCAAAVCVAAFLAARGDSQGGAFADVVTRSIEAWPGVVQGVDGASPIWGWVCGGLGKAGLPASLAGRLPAMLAWLLCILGCFRGGRLVHRTAFLVCLHPLLLVSAMRLDPFWPAFAVVWFAVRRGAPSAWFAGLSAAAAASLQPLLVSGLVAWGLASRGTWPDRAVRTGIILGSALVGSAASWIVSHGHGTEPADLIYVVFAPGSVPLTVGFAGLMAWTIGSGALDPRRIAVFGVVGALLAVPLRWGLPSGPVAVAVEQAGDAGRWIFGAILVAGAAGLSRVKGHPIAIGLGLLVTIGVLAFATFTERAAWLAVLPVVLAWGVAVERDGEGPSEAVVRVVAVASAAAGGVYALL